MSLRAAVIGSPVAHSLSPAIHRAGFGSLGIDWTYDAIDCGTDELAAFMTKVRDDGFGGLSVTMPLKEGIVRLLDRLDPNALATGAVLIRCGCEHAATRRTGRSPPPTSRRCTASSSRNSSSVCLRCASSSALSASTAAICCRSAGIGSAYSPELRSRPATTSQMLKSIAWCSAPL